MGLCHQCKRMSQRNKKDKPSQGLGKDGRGESCRRKKMADRMLWEKHIHVAEFKLCKFLF